MKVEVSNPGQFLSRLYYLAWKACGGPLGMGQWQDNPDATEEDVWNNICNHGDYPYKMNDVPSGSEGTDVRADYVFGRMMKLSSVMGRDYVSFPGSTNLHPEYQSWARKYRTLEDLVAATKESLEGEG